MIRLRNGVLFAALSVFVSACAGGRTPVPGTAAENAEFSAPSEAAAPPTAVPAPHGAPRGDTSSPSMGSIHIDERIVTACGNLANPHFAFDSASIRDQAGDTLRVV